MTRAAIAFASLAAILTACAGADDPAATQAESLTPAKAEKESQQGGKMSRPIRLYAMDCGRIDMLDLSLFTQGDEYNGRTNNAAVMCFLIRHPDGDLMWDAGLPEALHEQENGLTNGPFHVSMPVTVSGQLASISVNPGDIEYFSLSHSHFDHVGNAPIFAGSTFLVEAAERTFMFRDEARADAQAFPAVAPLENAETIEFDGDYDVFGDGRVKILSMPGHTPGHTALYVDLGKEGPVLLTGDLYHLIESREKRLVPKFNTSVEDTLASMDRFEAFAKEKGARVIIQHSLEHMNELPLAPEYLE